MRTIYLFVVLSLLGVLETANCQALWGHDLPLASDPTMGISTSDGHYLLCYTSGYNAVIEKISSEGQSLWSHQLGEQGPNFSIWVGETSENNYLYYYSDGDVDEMNDWSWHHLVTFSPDGNILNSCQVGDGYQSAYVMESGFIINDSSIVFAKHDQMKLINTNGDIIWEMDLESLRNIEKSPDNQILVLKDSEVQKISLEGLVLDTIPYSFSVAPVFTPHHFVVMHDGIVIATIYPNSATERSELHVLKIDSIGNSIWENLYEFDSNLARINDVVTLQDGRFAVIGSLNSNRPMPGYIISFSNTGILEWDTYLESDGVIAPAYSWDDFDQFCILVGYSLETDIPFHYQVGLYFMNMTYSGDHIYTVNVYPTENIPTSFAIDAYPNPFNSSITFELPTVTEEGVNFCIYSIIGESIYELTNFELRTIGPKIVWNPKYLSSGIYFAVLQGKDSRATKKVLLVK